MSHRRLAAPLTAIAIMALTPICAAAQSTHPSPSPRTAWGDPDLQGIWNNATTTPLERPDDIGEQELLTDEERAARDEAGDRAREQRGETSGTGETGSYNNFWTERGIRLARTSLIVEPPDGRLPPLTPEAHSRLTSPEAQRLADVRGGRLPADSWEQLDLSDRCIWYRGIPSLPTGYNNNYHIVQNPDYVAILQEHIHEVRFISLVGRPHVSQAIRQYAGDPRGHWEGDTLVVETTNFNNKAFIRNFSGDLSEALHVVERFTRVGPTTLDYEFTVNDPQTWTRPWKGSLPMARIEGPMFEYACHEGNYGLRNILAGSRAQEEAPKQGSR